MSHQIALVLPIFETSVQREKMDRVSSFLVLSLILCYCSSQINTMKIKMISKPPEAINAQVELDCETNYPDFGVYWIRQNSGRNPDFIIYANARSSSGSGDQHYGISKSGNTYKLIVKAFKNKDEGTYHCIVLRNQILYLSSGISIFLPVRTTPVPTTQRRAPETPNPNNRHITSESNKCSEATAADGGLIIPCDPYIWIPLSGGCFLLLITLVITITVCCDPRRRRRRCQCKRPLNGTNGKKTMPR